MSDVRAAPRQTLPRVLLEGRWRPDGAAIILEDLVETVAPRRLEVVGDWNVRGGIKTVVTVRYERGAAGSTPGNASGRTA